MTLRWKSNLITLSKVDTSSKLGHFVENDFVQNIIKSQKRNDHLKKFKNNHCLEFTYGVFLTKFIREKTPKVVFYFYRSRS
jgi:hypothetical protein